MDKYQMADWWWTGAAGAVDDEVNNKNKLKRSLGEEVEEVEEGSGPGIIRLVARFIYSAVSTIQTQQSEMRDEMVSAHSPCQSHPIDGRPFVQLSSSNL